MWIVNYMVMKRIHITTNKQKRCGLALIIGAVLLAPFLGWGQTQITSLDNIGSTGDFIITADIDASSFTSSIQSFSGTLQANIDPATKMPYRIKNLNVPLFTTLTGTVKNLVIENVTISRSGMVGAVACTANGAARIYNVGILAGTVGSTGTSTGANSTDCCGGLVGLLDGTARVVNCYNYADITGGNRVGGIVGQDVSCTKWCYNMGEVRTPNENDYTCRVGGIAGITSTPLHQCFNMGVVRGSKMVVGYTGGLVGEGYAVSSYNVGEVIGNKSTGTGGITGTFGGNDYNLRTYNAARVTGTGNTSPINGSGYREQYSYFDSQLCPSTRKINGTAMTTRQMLDSGLYEKSVELYPAANKRSYWFSSENGWTLVDTLYPQITYFAGTPASIASVTL